MLLRLPFDTRFDRCFSSYPSLAINYLLHHVAKPTIRPRPFAVLPEENRTRARAMNLHMACCAISVLSILIVRRARRFNRTDTVVHAMTSQTQLVDRAVFQKTRVRRAVRNVTRRATFGFHRSVFVNKWPLLVRMTLHAGRVGAGRQSRLLEFKTTMRIMAIAALHDAFENLVMER